METRIEGMLTGERKREMLTQLMERHGFESQAQFARHMGVSTQNVNSWFSRGAYNVELLAVKFPDISGDWLLRGEGPMMKEDRLPAPASADATDYRKTIDAIVAEQRLTAKAQAQADKILAILNSLADSFRKLGNPQ